MQTVKTEYQKLVPSSNMVTTYTTKARRHMLTVHEATQNYLNNGTCYPWSGDARLHMEARLLKMRMSAEYGKQRQYTEDEGVHTMEPPC